jgi:hypothetical protein
MKQPEYTEGPKAIENFELMAAAIFKAPKSGGRKTRKKSSKTISEGKPKNYDGAEDPKGFSFEERICPKNVRVF